MLRVNVTARFSGTDGVLAFETQLTQDDIEVNPVVPGGSIMFEGVGYTIDTVERTGGAQVGEDWIAEVTIEVTAA